MDNKDKKKSLWDSIIKKELELGEATVLETYRPPEFTDRELKSSVLPFCKISTKEMSLQKYICNNIKNDALPSEDFQITEKIGQGGMGTIFRARQNSLQREVAIKIMNENSCSFSHFLSEAYISGRLEHSNIAPVHWLGQTYSGTPQFVMKLVHGCSWLELLHTDKGKDLSLKDHLNILLKVCDAISYAHSQGVIHRDIKPDNVMVGKFGEVFLMDWGLAVALDKDICQDNGIIHVSEIESLAGTPGYMSPELANGEGSLQDERTDVYLLGACLHEVVTRKVRHVGENIMTVLTKVIKSAPHSYDSSVPRELANICNKATSKSRENRYANVAEFREAVEMYLEHIEANVLIHKGHHLLKRLQESINTQDFQAIGQSRQLYGVYSEAKFAFQHALEIWPEVEEAKEGLRQLNYCMLSHAISNEDIHFCNVLCEECEAPELLQRAEKLRQKLESREKELDNLRKTVKRYDWGQIAEPLGTVFIWGGTLGALGCFFTGKMYRAEVDFFTLFVFCASFCLVIGAIALYVLRNTRIRDSVISEHFIWTWGAIALGCFSNSFINEIMGLEGYYGISSAALMMAIGFAAVAFQTQKWMFVPAIVFWIGAFFIGIYDDYGIDIYALCWFLCITGVGIAFRKGLTLEPERKSS